MAEGSNEVSTSFSSPDETRNFPNGKAEIVTVGGTKFLRGTFQPGWHWAEHVKPIVGTDSCQVNHTGVIVSGRLGIRLTDGREFELGPGDAFVIPPGHDGWVIGNEPVVEIDVTGLTYAQPQ